MALVLADRVRETTTTTGTGTISLGGPVSGFEGFSTAIGNANTTYYAIVDAATGAWEVGLGTYTSSGSTLARTTILSSSNAGSAVNFAAGTKDVFVTQPAERALYLNGAGTGVDAGAAAFTANGVVYASSTSALATGSALTFDGTNLGVANGSVTAGNSAVVLTGRFSSGFPTSGAGYFQLQTNNVDGITGGLSIFTNSAGTLRQSYRIHEDTPSTNSYQSWNVNGSEQARLTSSGLEIKQSQLIGYSSYAGIGTNGLAVAGNVGVGTASPATSLHIVKDIGGGTSGATAFISLGGNSAYRAGVAGYQFNFSDRMGLGLYYYGASGQQLGALLDSAGNLGLGVTPSAWWSGSTALQIGLGGYVQGRTGTAAAVEIGSNQFINGSVQRTYIQNGAAAYYEQSGGNHQWFIAASGTAGNAISFTQAMTLDASGRLLIKATSNTGANTKLAVGSGLTSGDAVAYISTENVDVDGVSISNWTGSATTNRVSLSFDSSGIGTFRIGMPGGVNAFQIYDALAGTERARISSDGTFRVKGAGTAGSTDAFQVAGTAPADSMVLNSSGNVGIGTTNPTAGVPFSNDLRIIGVAGSGAASAASAGIIALQNNRATPAVDDVIGVISFLSANNTQPLKIDIYGQLKGSGGGTGGFGADLVFATRGDNSASIDARARITSGGDLLVGTTTYGGGSNVAGFGANPVGQIAVERDGGIAGVFNRFSSDGQLVLFRRQGTTVGDISVTTLLTTYNTTSDYRLKNNQAPLTGSGAFIDALQPKTWNWAQDGSKGAGFIAHEFSEVSPSSVSGTKDAVGADGKPVYQAMQASSAEVIANLVAEIQDLRKRLAAAGI